MAILEELFVPGIWHWHILNGHKLMGVKWAKEKPSANSPKFILRLDQDS